jgi:hypothetical protein
MQGKRLFNKAILASFTWAFCLSVLNGASPKPETPKNEYQLNPQAGAWLICCASYSGPDSQEMAKQVVNTLRTRDKLPAYVLNYSQSSSGKNETDSKDDAPAGEGRKRKFTRPSEQCAVVIGGYQTIEQARGALDKVKGLQTPEIKLEEGKSTTDIVSLYVPVPGKGLEIRREMVNPFTRSFVTRNPTIPSNIPPPPKFDPSLKSLNSGDATSLFRCGKKWTLVVKEYRGATLVQPTSGAQTSGTFLEKIGLGKGSDTLNACALQARETCRVLKKVEFDAYTLHTRTSSMVTIGAFDSENDPKMQQVIANLSKMNLGPLDLFPRPLPMEVPDVK